VVAQPLEDGGHHLAVIGSAINSGMTYGGVPLAVGTDVVMLAKASKE
jgi:hypothetical protein